MRAALSYLAVMCAGFLPFAFTQTYGTTIRSHGETVAPMTASFIAVAVNLIGNYLLIYGKFGLPALGVGAAWATVIARFVELVYIAAWAHTHASRVPFIVGVFDSLYVPRELTVSCIKKGMPLLLNEALWSGGKTFITFLFDSCFCWAFSIPVAFFLAHYTQLPILPMYAAVASIELIKVVIGVTLVNKGIWIRDITV